MENLIISKGKLVGKGASSKVYEARRQGSFKYSNFHKFCFYILNFYFNCSSNIKTILFFRVTLEMIEVWSLVGDMKTKFIKIAIFKKQIFCSGFKYKSHKSSRF